jgi:hypothetical protein
LDEDDRAGRTPEMWFDEDRDSIDGDQDSWLQPTIGRLQPLPIRVRA